MLKYSTYSPTVSIWWWSYTNLTLFFVCMEPTVWGPALLSVGSAVPDMTYNVFNGTLNPTQSIRFDLSAKNRTSR